MITKCCKKEWGSHFGYQIVKILLIGNNNQLRKVIIPLKLKQAEAEVVPSSSLDKIILSYVKLNKVNLS